MKIEKAKNKFLADDREIFIDLLHTMIDDEWIKSDEIRLSCEFICIPTSNFTMEPATFFCVLENSWNFYGSCPVRIVKTLRVDHFLKKSFLH